MCRSRTEWKIADISAWKTRSGTSPTCVWRIQPVPQQPQPLHRVDRVHRRLHRQVHVVVVEQHKRLLDEPAPVVKAQRTSDAEEVRQRLGRRHLITDHIRGVGQQTGRRGVTGRSSGVLGRCLLLSRGSGHGLVFLSLAHGRLRGRTPVDSVHGSTGRRRAAPSHCVQRAPGRPEIPRHPQRAEGRLTAPSEHSVKGQLGAAPSIRARCPPACGHAICHEPRRKDPAVTTAPRSRRRRPSTPPERPVTPGDRVAGRRSGRGARPGGGGPAIDGLSPRGGRAEPRPARRAGPAAARGQLRAPLAEDGDARGQPGAAAAAAARPADPADDSTMDPERTSTWRCRGSSTRCGTCTPTTCCPPRSPGGRLPALPGGEVRRRRRVDTTWSSRVAQGCRRRGSVVGVEVTQWNGMPIERAVAVNADRFAGSNNAARHARGVESLTIRSLRLPPASGRAMGHRRLPRPDGVRRELRAGRGWWRRQPAPVRPTPRR